MQYEDLVKGMDNRRFLSHARCAGKRLPLCPTLRSSWPSNRANRPSLKPIVDFLLNVQRVDLLMQNRHPQKRLSAKQVMPLVTPLL
jgi:hypothetical protein